METQKRNRLLHALWILLLAAGTAVLLLGITHESLWYDESYTGSLVNQGFLDIIRITAGDSHPPLYYLMLRVFTLVFGNTVLTLRLFSVLGALLLAALGMGPVKRAAGASAGVLFTILVFCFPATHFMAQEARMYTWAAFFVTGSALYGYLASRDGQKQDWVKFALFSIAAMYTHYYALLAVAVLCFLLLLITAAGRKRWRPFLTAIAVMVLAYIPWATALLAQMGRVSQKFWIPPVTGQIIWQTLTYPFASKFYFNAMADNVHITFYAAMGILALGTVVMLFKKDKSIKLLLLALGVFFLTIAAGIAASWLIRPVLVERYMVPLLGLLAIGMALGIASLRRKWLMAIAGALMVFLSCQQIAAIHEKRVDGPMAEAVSYLQGQLQPGDVFLHTDEHTFGTFCYYFPETKNYYYQRKGCEGFSNYGAFKPNGQTIEGLADIEGTPRVWLLQRPGASDAYQSMTQWQLERKLKVSPMKEFKIPDSWYQFKMYLGSLTGKE